MRELGLRYAPDLRFFKDNTLAHLDAHDQQKEKYLEEARKEKETIEKQKRGELTGYLAKTAKPLYDMLEYLKVYKTLSEGERIAFISQIPAEFQTRFAQVMAKN